MNIDYEKIFASTQESADRRSKDASTPSAPITDNGEMLEQQMGLMKSLLTELQTMRDRERYKKLHQSEEVDRLYREVHELKIRCEESKRMSEKGSAAVEKLVQEREEYSHACAEAKMKLALLEGENAELLKTNHELFTNNEHLQRNEFHLSAHVASLEQAITVMQKQFERTKEIISSCESNKTLLEADIRKLALEVQEAQQQRVVLKANEESQLRELTSVSEKLKKASEENAMLRAQLAEERQRVQNASFVARCQGDCDHAKDLGQRLDAERTALGELREALVVAAASQARLMAINQATKTAME